MPFLQEFEQLKVRDDELDELDNLTHDCAEVRVAGGSENVHGKVRGENFRYRERSTSLHICTAFTGQHSHSISHIEGEGQLVFPHLRPTLRRPERD